MPRSLAAAVRFLAAFVMAIAAVMLRYVVDPVPESSPADLLVYLAVYVAARWLGAGPAVLVLGVGLAAFVYFCLPPHGQLAVTELRHQIGLIVSVVLGLTLIWVVARRTRELVRLEREIANRELAEARLRMGREEFRALAEKCPTGIFRTDASGACTYVNEYWCRLSGRTGAEALGGGWGEAIHPEDLPRVLDTWRDAFAARRSYTVEYRIRLPEGRLRHAITTAQPVFDERGDFTHYIGTVLDISDLKQAYSSLARKEEVLRNLIEAQEYEKQTIGHDIHDGLLQYAIGSRMLLESLVHDHGTTPDADVIETVLGYLGKGIAEGRQVVRGMRPPLLDDLGLGAALEDLADQFAGLGVRVECRIDADLTALSPSLQTTIYRVMQESLNNVRKHSGSDRAVVSLRQTEGGLRLEVEDHGRGFDVGAGGPQGFGLIGMTERVRLAGGTLRIDSNPGRGTRVSAELPLPVSAVPAGSPGA